MDSTQVRCTRCENVFPLEAETAWTVRTCPGCHERLQVCAFPALRRPLRSRPARNNLAAEGQAGCFFHAHKPAAVPCDACGRFLCDLCDLQFQDRHFCATCLDSAQKGGTGLQNIESPFLKERVFLPQNLALGLALYTPLTLLGIYVIPLSAPFALWVAIRNWKREDGFQVRGKWRFVVSIALALLQLLGVALFIVFMVYVFRETAKKT
ncbi:MAG: hypothetical protein JWO30_3859 [Fibrobacteres bacterium]|nr:hypothetical protein [Fibrobacterota bacterium]